EKLFATSLVSSEKVSGRYFSRLSLALLASHMNVSVSILQRALEVKSPRIENNLVRSLIEKAPVSVNGHGTEQKKRPGPKRGSKYKAEEEREYFKIGQSVEQRIPVHLKDKKYAIEAARRETAEKNHGYEAGVISEYHRLYRRFMHLHGRPL